VETSSPQSIQDAKSNENEWKIEKREFPNALPGMPGTKNIAFGICPTELHDVLVCCIDESNYELNINYPNEALKNHSACDMIKQLVDRLECEGSLQFKTTKRNKLTLPEADREKCEIPLDADNYCWGSRDHSIPLTEEHKDWIGENIKATDSPDLRFLLNGGFMYFQQQKLIRCNCLKIDEAGLYFSPPNRFSTTAEHRKKRNELVRAGRFREITIPFFKERGAKYFCWLLPKELDCPHGGFLYLFSEDITKYHPKDCYFEVLTLEKYKKKWGLQCDMIQKDRKLPGDEPKFQLLLKLQHDQQIGADEIVEIIQCLESNLDC